MRTWRVLLAILLMPTVTKPLLAQEADVFSGPQTGEAVPAFPVTAVLGAESGSTIDLAERAGDQPLLLVIVHERTRPAFGLMNAIARFAESVQEKRLTAGVAFLSADPTETEGWLKQVARNLPAKTIIGVSPDGQEGPGAWGLNRNVAMTIIVANEGRVTANFALVQPSIAQDGPGILKAVVDVTGGGEVPDIAKFSNQMMRRPQPPASDGPDENLRSLLRPVIQKEATEEQVTRAAEAVEAYAAENPAAAKQVGEITRRIIEAGRLESYGTPKAQEYLKKWSEAYVAPPKPDRPAPVR